MSKAKKKQKSWVDELSAAERAVLAVQRMNAVADQVDDLLYLHESNRILLYTDSVADKIPRSYAANTFNLVTECLFRYQVIRLCALWDTSSKDRASIPAVIDLIRNKCVREQIAQERYKSRIAEVSRFPNPSTDPEVNEKRSAVVRHHREEQDQEDTRNVLRGLAQCICAARKIKLSEPLEALRGFRDNHIAHTLQKGPTEADPVLRATYGQEEELLEKTLELVSQLDLHLTDTHRSWDETKHNANRCASELWHSVSFSIAVKPSKRA